MAKLSYDMLQDDSKSTFGNSPRVGFFSLKDDGDEAIVRFLCDSVSEFEVFSVHSITLGGKFRKVNCIRDPKAPIDDCPLCREEYTLQRKIYVRLIQYERDENGNLVALPKVWERAGGFASQLKALIDEYGPLSEVLFKVKRSGKAGSRETSYNMFYCNPNVYKDELYPKHTEYFNNYKIEGGLVLNKSFDELETFLNTGAFPEKAVQATAKTVVEVAKPSTPAVEVDVAPWEPAPSTQGESVHAEQRVAGQRTYNVPEDFVQDTVITPLRVPLNQQSQEQQAQPQSYRPVRRNYY